MVRQLSPTLYMDSDETVLKELYPHLTEVVQVTANSALGAVAPTVKISKTFCDYFVP